MTMAMNMPLQRKLTKAFIDRLPVELTLVPRARVKKPTGGFGWEDQEPRPPQTFTLIEQTGLSGTPRVVRTSDGVEREVEFELLGEWDSQLSEDDWFLYQDKEFTVVDLWIDNGYERRALVTARG